ncbi:hypothetical protein [Coleofasciculus sp. FACHB-SPT9]|uniref:hypothetical protein n=1 Tax=Cyanophyceae TaxID=3028117 RepID=UPI00168694C6|nr:hypothetical protein [Coleofasciculus sp. FACHB-SPT9]MBD1889588.1 hypothetical protein [Coleofasciculus sp. FACHB-SPT9]
MQLKDKEEQESAKISSQLNLPIQAEETTEDTATNAASKEQLSRNHLSHDLKPLFVLIGILGALGLGALFTLCIFAIYDMSTTSSDTCIEIHSEDTIQPL